MPIQCRATPNRIATAVLTGTMLAGCVTERPSEQSGGPAQTLTVAPGPTVSPIPDLLVTLTARGAEVRDFVDIRGVLAYPDGAFVVADAGIPRVFLFSATGELLAEMGQGGSGPGEFREPRLVAVWGDSLAVYDPPQRRLTVFARSGAFARSVTIPSDHPAQVVGLLADKSVLLKETTFDGKADAAGLTAAHARLLRISEGRRDTLAVIGDGLWSSRGYRFYAWLGAVTLADSIIWAGEGNAPRLTQYRANGSFLATFEWAQVARSVNDSDRARMQAMARERGAAPNFAAADRFADSVPLFARLLPDPLGGVWAIGYEPPFAPPEGAWRIDEQALTIAKVELPPRFRPTQVGIDYLFGVLTDEDGVGRPARYPLERTGTGHD
jgi:hypothetical protein